MKLVKLIPNVLTLIRLILSFIYLGLLGKIYLGNSSYLYFKTALIVILLIYITDFADGKIARAAKATSIFGAVFDVVVDFIFIITSIITLNLFNIIPIWFTILVVIKFSEFLITSYIFKKYNYKANNIFIFDYLGRIAAVNFFLVPGIALFSNIGVSLIYINMFLYITLILVIASSMERCLKCLRTIKIKQQAWYNSEIL